MIFGVQCKLLIKQLNSCFLFLDGLCEAVHFALNRGVGPFSVRKSKDALLPCCLHQRTNQIIQSLVHIHKVVQR